MTNEERDLISQFVARVGGNAQGGFSRSVPATTQSLPPIDPEADRFIAEQFQSHPEARYRVTQMAVVQEAALAEAGNRIQQLQQALQQAQQAQQQAAQPQSKGIFGSLFGGGAAQPQQQQSPWNQGQGQPQQQQYAPPQQQYGQAQNYPPNVQAGTFQQGGSGFLGGALKTAAGVAGGVVGANLLMDMFSGHGGGGMFGGGLGGGGFGGGMPQETIVNNNYGGAPDSGSGWDNNAQSAPDPGWDNTAAPDNSGGGWDDNSGGGGGGWDDNSNT